MIYGQHGSAKQWFRAALILALLIGLPIEPLVHLLSRLEMGVGSFWNRDQRASPGITASSGFMEFDRECSEAAQLNPLTACHWSDNFVEYSVDNFLNVSTVEMRILLPHAPNEFGLNHSKFPPGHDNDHRAVREGAVVMVNRDIFPSAVTCGLDLK